MFGLGDHFADTQSILFPLFLGLVVTDNFQENIRVIQGRVGGFLQIQDRQLKEQAKTKQAFHRKLEAPVENNPVGERIGLSPWPSHRWLWPSGACRVVKGRGNCRKKDLDGSQGSSMASVGRLVAYLSPFFSKMALMVLSTQRAFRSGADVWEGPSSGCLGSDGYYHVCLSFPVFRTEYHFPSVAEQKHSSRRLSSSSSPPH